MPGVPPLDGQSDHKTMTRQLTAAIRRALASSRKVLGPAGVPPRPLDEEETALEDEDELTPREQPHGEAEQVEPPPA